MYLTVLIYRTSLVYLIIFMYFSIPMYFDSLYAYMLMCFIMSVRHDFFLYFPVICILNISSECI